MVPSRASSWGDQWAVATLSINFTFNGPGRNVPCVDVRNGEAILCSVPISQVFTVADSTRYFVINRLDGNAWRSANCSRTLSTDSLSPMTRCQGTSPRGGSEAYLGIAFNVRSDSNAFLAALEEHGKKEQSRKQDDAISAPPTVEKATLKFLEKVGVSQRDLKVRRRKGDEDGSAVLVADVMMATMA